MRQVGYVAFVDLLGFSARMRGGAAETFFETYKAALDRALTDKVPVKYVVSSDSIVLYHAQADEQGLVEIVIACARLFRELLLVDVPCRGAVSFGTFFEETTKAGTIIAGTPIIEAFDYEQRQDWVGIILAPSVLTENAHIIEKQNLRDKESRNEPARSGRRLIQRWAVPFHGDEGTFTAFAVVPTDNALASKDYREGLQNVIRRLRVLRAVAPDPASQRKYAEPLDLVLQAHNEER